MADDKDEARSGNGLQRAWDRRLSAGTATAHSLCATGDPLFRGDADCITDICDTDPHCCQANGYRDAWFTGFTPTLSTAVWVGFDKKKGLRNSNGTGITGGRGAAPIWADFMIQATSGEPARKFTIPADIHFEQADPATGYRATGTTEHPLRVALKESQRLNAPPGKQPWDEV